jgi:hypothetical protein
MNDPATFDLYMRLYELSKGRGQNVLEFKDCEPSKERTLHSFAMKLKLSYSYDAVSQTVSIQHPRSAIAHPATHPHGNNDTSRKSSFVTDFGDSLQLSPLRQSSGRPALVPLQSPLSYSDADWTKWTRDPAASPMLSRQSSVASFKGHSSRLSINSAIESEPGSIGDEDRGRSAFHSRASSFGQYSVASGQSASYSEIVFDSKSGQSSRASSRSGIRRGPLSEVARAGMKALKVVGACWRCKILRKRVRVATYISIWRRKDEANGIQSATRTILAKHAPQNRASPAHRLGSVLAVGEGLFSRK